MRSAKAVWFSRITCGLQDHLSSAYGYVCCKLRTSFSHTSLEHTLRSDSHIVMPSQYCNMSGRCTLLTGRFLHYSASRQLHYPHRPISVIQLLDVTSTHLPGCNRFLWSLYACTDLRVHPDYTRSLARNFFTASLTV